MADFKQSMYLAAQSSTFWLVFLLAYVVLSLVSAGHALLNKRDSRSALGWVVVCLTLPILGSLAYLLFGINRLKNKAKLLAISIKSEVDTKLNLLSDTYRVDEVDYLQAIGNIISSNSITRNNTWECLRNGEAAFPAMLEAINKAEHQILLSTYIFANDAIGDRFLFALIAARKRGISIYVLIDGIGARYSFPSMVKILRKSGIRCAEFLPPRWLPPQISINLRNHRKILVIDQKIAFTGGINISEKHMVENNSKGAADLHFFFTGGIVMQLCELFWRDWQVATGEFSKFLKSRSHLKPSSGSCRLIADGPDDDLDKLSLILNAIISAAKHKVTLMTPYFIPSREMIGALLSAVHRGVKVQIILPEKSNLRYVDWATQHMLWELLAWDVEIYYKSAPFEHSKLLLIDDCYSMVGSANIDPRSLRLNFELMVEIFDCNFCDEMTHFSHQMIKQSKRLSLQSLENRPLWKKLRDGVFWLFSPYL